MLAKGLKVLEVLVYLVLLAIALANIVQGPLPKYIRSMFNETKIITTTQNLQPIVPTLTICRYPGFKTSEANSKLNNGSMTNLTMAHMRNNTFQPADIIYGTELSSSLLENATVELNASAWRAVTVDSDFVGTCFALDLDKYAAYMPPNSPAKVFIYLYEYPYDAQVYYTLQVTEKNDFFLTGLLNLDELTPAVGTVRQRQSALFDVHMKEFKAILDCDPSNTLISKCVGSFLDERYPNCSQDKLDKMECSVNDYQNRTMALMLLRLAGYSVAFNESRCLPPCNQHLYSLKTVLTIDETSVSTNRLLSRGSGVTSIIVGSSQTLEMKLLTEQHAYTFSDLISGVGGILGVFIGWSMFSMYPWFVKLVWACDGKCDEKRKAKF